MLHSTELCCTLSELCCTRRATLHLLSYTAPFWAKLHPTWPILHPSWPMMRPKSYAAPSELSCNLLSYAVFFWATCFLLSYAAPYWATPHPKWATRHPKHIMSPVYRSFADPSYKINDFQRNPAKHPALANKSAKVYHSLYSSTEQLQVVLWTYIFLWLGLNNEKSINTLPLRLSPR